MPTKAGNPVSEFAEAELKLELSWKLRQSHLNLCSGFLTSAVACEPGADLRSVSCLSLWPAGWFIHGQEGKEECARAVAVMWFLSADFMLNNIPNVFLRIALLVFMVCCRNQSYIC